MSETNLKAWQMERVLDTFKFTLECRFGMRGHQLKGAEVVTDLGDLDFTKLDMDSYQLVCSFAQNGLLCAGYDIAGVSEPECPLLMDKSRLKVALASYKR